MEKIRVLIVERSPEIRKALTAYLSHDSEISVVGVASNHMTALKQAERLHPDIITLDEDLSCGLSPEALTNLRHIAGNIPILTLGTIDSSTIQAILHNASLSRRPHRNKHPAIVCKSLEDKRFTELCRRIHELTEQIQGTSPQIRRSRVIPAPTGAIQAIGIAVSTGGPNALARIMAALDPEISVPIFVTQHMSAQFTPLLAERLNAQTSLIVAEAKPGEVVVPGRIYVAPGDYHLSLEQSSKGTTIRLTDEEVSHGCRPSADVMFQAIAEVYGSVALGIVLTGMGTDGQQGCEALKRCGAYVIAQDEQSSTVWGMPKAVIRAGFADEVLPLDEISGAINQRATPTKRST